MRDSRAMVTESGGEMSRSSSSVPPVDGMTIEEEEEGDVADQTGTGDEGDSSEFRAVAARVVEDVISRASEEVAHREEKVASSPSKAFSPPTIQIDLVGSQTPSPDEEPETDMKTRQQQSDNQQTDASQEAETSGNVEGSATGSKSEQDQSASSASAGGSTPPTREASAESKASDGDPDVAELREFAFSYVKDVIAKAAKAAEEKMLAANAAQAQLGTTTVAQLEEEPATVLKKTGSPWYLRLREAFMRFFRSACPCRARQRDTSS